MSANAKEDIDRIVEAVIFLYTETRRATKDVARTLGLTGPQVSTIKLLEACGDLNLSTLSERLSARNSTVTGLVDRMVRNGLVRRRRCQEDRRVVLIELTDRGRELAQAIPVTAMQTLQSALRALETDERRTLRAILRKLSDRVRAEVEGVEIEGVEAMDGPRGAEGS